MFKWIARYYKTYTKEEVLKPLINRPFKNLFEMASNHSTQGVGLKFYRKTWPSNSYYIITKIKFEDIRHGRAWGIKTWNGVTSTTEEEIRSPLKKGAWRFSEQDKNI